MLTMHACMLSHISWVPRDPMHCNPPRASVHRVLQARILDGLPCSPPGDLPDPGIKPEFLMSPSLAGGSLSLVPLKII